MYYKHNIKIPYFCKYAKGDFMHTLKIIFRKKKMISLLNRNDKLNQDSNSLNISYRRDVNIVFGNYPYPDIIHNFIVSIKSNLKTKMKNYTNVQGGMTDWKYFIDKPDFINFVSFLINKHQVSHPDLFQHFLEKEQFKMLGVMK